MGALDPWASYTQFHLEEVKCLMCRANAEDLAAEGGELRDPGQADQMFQSSVGFLSRMPNGE